MSVKLWAVRGATTVASNTPDQILAATRELLSELLVRNRIEAEAIVSIIFTATPDLNSEFPAAAARQLGLNNTPLLCMQEIAKPDALPRCLRILIHFYTELNKDQLCPVYLHESVKLRPDLNPK